MKSQGLKFKLLKMVEILRRETDADHPITTQGLVSRLTALGITAERRSIYTDIAQLTQAGYPIKIRLVGLAGEHKSDLLKKNTICFNTRKHTNEAIYDVVETLQEALCAKRKASFCYFDLNEKAERVTLRFPRKLIGVVFDKFGEKTKLKEIAPDRFETNVRVQVSPTFKGWLAQFEGEMEVERGKELI